MVYKYIKLRVRSDNVFHTTIMKNSTEVPLKTSSVWRLPYDAVREGNGNPLQCSCLENPGDGGAWWAAIYGVAQSLTQLKWLSSSSSRITVCLTVWESAKLLCSVAVPSRIPTSDMEVPRFSTSPPALDAVSVFMIAILVGGKWHLIVVLTCAFRVTDSSVIRSVTSDSLWPHGL